MAKKKNLTEDEQNMAEEMADKVKRRSKKDPDAHLDIPAFLRRQTNGKPSKAKPPKAQTTVVKPPVVEPSPLEVLEPDFRSYVEAEIKANRVQPKWLEDPGTVMMLRRQYGSKQDRKAESLAQLAAYKAEHPRPPAKPKPAYAEDTMCIVSFDEANPRKPGSANYDKYEGFKKYMAANPQATVLDVVSNTGYYRNDLMHDVKQGRITLGDKPAQSIPASTLVAAVKGHIARRKKAK